MTSSKCLSCDINLIGQQISFCSNKCSHRYHYNSKDPVEKKQRFSQCLTCEKQFVSNRRKFCSKKCYSGHYKITNNKTKEKLTFLAGGCCQSCGYDKNYAALQFHHIDPKTKLFPLNAASCGMYPWEELTKELVKCLLLCANCHFELHNPKREKVNTTH